MRKLFSALLAVAMILSMVAIMLTTVAAETVTDLTNGYEHSQNITATYVPSTDVATYSIDITWGALAFTYHEEELVWNTETKEYDVAEEAYWDWEDGANEITITNRSNAPVKVTLAITDVADDGVTLAWADGVEEEFTMDPATPGVGGADGTPTEKVVTLTVTGALAEDAQELLIGTITIALAKVEENG